MCSHTRTVGRQGTLVEQCLDCGAAVQRHDGYARITDPFEVYGSLEPEGQRAFALLANSDQSRYHVQADLAAMIAKQADDYLRNGTHPRT